ncbi:hypothetical protein ACFYUD_00670 [Nocardia tengchongensis]|uniref:hypothetical protein n=1 Tax=Nocardia tengchongensis TaxID=2055889 RepID=UPI0036B70D36
MRLHPQPGSTRAAVDNALREVTQHLGIDLPAFLAHVAIGPAVQPQPAGPGIDSHR